MDSKASQPPSYDAIGEAASAPSGAPESTPIYSTGGSMDSKLGKIIVIILTLVLSLMFLLAVIFCIVGAVENKQAKNFALLINILLSTAVTGILVFWLYRGVLVSSMLWYIFVQCTFLFFQLVTTDIFAWYGETSDTPINPTVQPPNNGSNNSSIYWF